MIPGRQAIFSAIYKIEDAYRNFEDSANSYAHNTLPQKREQMLEDVEAVITELKALKKMALKDET